VGFVCTEAEVRFGQMRAAKTPCPVALEDTTLISRHKDAYQRA
jgi:hypothetical protein